MTKIFVEESDLDYDPAVVANILVDSNSSLEKDAPNSVLLTELKNHPNMQ